ncbi:hypothetical protein [Klebsiella pneumoniae]|uniref:hypothetical protein n=1 Tax=Klebsiella pneumoniae TaxID=573 RepID=UPI002FF309CD
MVKKSLRQFTLMATATVTLLLGSVPLYAQKIIVGTFISSTHRIRPEDLSQHGVMFCVRK